MVCAALASCASGFSSSVGTPASASRSPICSCVAVGVATTHRSTPSSSSPSTLLEHPQVGHVLADLVPGVHRRDQLDAGQGPQHARVVASHVPQPDQPGAQVCAVLGHPVTASVTAATTCSSCSWLRAGCTGSESTSAAARSVCGSPRSSPKAGSRWIGIG